MKGKLEYTKCEFGVFLGKENQANDKVSLPKEFLSSGKPNQSLILTFEILGVLNNKSNVANTRGNTRQNAIRRIKNPRNSESALTNSLSNVVASLNTKTLQFAFWKMHIMPLLQYDPVTSVLCQVESGVSKKNKI